MTSLKHVNGVNSVGENAHDTHDSYFISRPLAFVIYWLCIISDISYGSQGGGYDFSLSGNRQEQINVR